MSKFIQKSEISTQRVAVDSVFLWRQGAWHMQAPDGDAVMPAPKGVSKLLDQLMDEGRLQEAAPGLYKMEGRLTQPLTNTAESPLFRLAVTKMPDGTTAIDSEQFRAGERLRADYEKAHFSNRVTMNYDANRVAQQMSAQFSDNHISTLTETALQARQDLHSALEAVGPELSGILLHVCCLASGLEQAELRMNLPKRSGKAVLQMALTRLARHYGFKKRVRHEGPANIGHWATEDFRPGISGRA
jgi:hypothetical protein